jgi:DNA (cytosine-5)-methyltransferase 1
MRCVNDLLPKAFLLENVHGINYSGKEEGFNLLKTLTDKINERHGTKYQLAWRVLNTADYGVPQVRQRFFLVAHREGKVFQFPDPTHNLGLWPCVTAWDAIGDLKPPPDEHLAMRGKWADLLPSIPEGENYLWHTNRKGGMRLFGWRTRYWSFLLKLAKDKPAWTIQAQPGPAIGPFHWTNRMLSSLELAALQTFPKGIKFCGGRVSVQRQLGNAVPSLMGEVLAREILLQFFGRRVGSTCKLSIELKRPIPPPEKVMRVPSQYLNLLGNHEDHPGDGLGPKGLSQEKLDAA